MDQQSDIDVTLLRSITNIYLLSIVFFKRRKKNCRKIDEQRKVCCKQDFHLVDFSYLDIAPKLI